MLAEPTLPGSPAIELQPTPSLTRMPVLVAEDNPVFQAMLRSMLTKWGYDVLLAHDGNEAWQLLQPDGAPRLAILDWMMPGMDGVEVCRRVRAAGREPYQYILLLTARTDAEDLVEGMDAGADDYLTKPFKTQELRVRLRAGRRILDLQAELLAAREALRDQATHDGLTGLLNRSSILEILRIEAERAMRERRPLALIMVDLDHFKAVNDTHGHLAGDAVLREASRRMKQVCRHYDAIGRYGGEEFLAVLPGSGREASLGQAERLRAVMASEPFVAGGVSLPVTCSIGVAWREHPLPSHLDAFLGEADAALYAAKNQGRNRVAAYSDG